MIEAINNVMQMLEDGEITYSEAGEFLFDNGDVILSRLEEAEELESQEGEIADLEARVDELEDEIFSLENEIDGLRDDISSMEEDLDQAYEEGYADGQADGGDE